MSTTVPPRPPSDPTNNTTTRNASSEQVQNQSEFYQLLIKSNAEAEKANELLKTRTELLELTAKQLKSETELQSTNATFLINSINEMERRSEQYAQSQERIKDINLEIQELIDSAASASVEEADAIQKKIDNLRKEKALKEKIGKVEKDIFKFMDPEGTLKVEEKLGSLLKIKVLNGRELGDVLKDQNLSEQKKRDALEEAKAINKDFLALQGKIKGVTEKVGKNLGLAASFGDTMSGQAVDLVTRFSQMKASLGEGGIKGLFGKIRNQTFNLKNAFGSIVDFAAKSALEISNLSRGIGAATGFGDKFNNQIASIAQSANMSGIEFQQAADAIKSMANNLSSFDAQAGQTNKEVGTTVAMLGKIGVQAATSTKNIDHLQRSMGLSTEAAADMSAQIALMGRNVGISTSKMMSNFEALKTRIAEFGNVGMRVFKEMNALVKATGLEIGTLTAASKKFDTFDQAADSVGKMNAVLGTQLSTLEMLSATDSERIMMIKQQVQMSVGNFDSLDRYTKMYIAQAMGVESVDKAQKLLNMSTAEYNKYTAGQQESADIQKELADATAELVPMMQQLKLAGTQILLVFKPIITVFSGIIKSISMLVGFVGSLFTGLGEIFGVDGSGGFMEAAIGLVALATMAMKMFGAAVATALGPIGMLAFALTALFGVYHLKGSPELWELPEHSAKGYENMANSMSVASEAANATSASMKQVHDSMHKAGGKSFSIEAMAKLDTEKIANGLNKVKSAMAELSTLKIDGFLAMATDGDKSSIVMGSQGVIKSLSEGRLAIDVNMPEIALPPINVVVEVNGSRLDGIIDARVEERQTRD